MLSRARISAIGSFVPEKRLTNTDFQSIVETTDQWILDRTGMKERRITNENEFSSHLAIKAVKQLVKTYKKKLTMWTSS
ncbi:3-oxoacyl-[acyl-carrier-protein] synthase III [Filibacter limicola]|uniref:3-oxoacyl-[acyl-carrier-protein] synthase III n=1 Tax=Sporosarcina limicola TaxID=34101 RepID=A0A927MQ22_9BACL|nr:3-oxoacyl-[acyl-carrier-protein] synthase III [Sporosarcina limicola]